MKMILAPLEDEKHAPAVLDVAAHVAGLFGASIEGVDAWPSHAKLLVADPAAVAALPRDELQAGHRARQLRARFERLLEAKGFVRESGERLGASYSWHEGAPLADSAIAALARVHDLTVLARPNADSTIPRVSLLEAVLFESGRPIMIAPQTPPATLGERVLVAWNRSSETARAIAMALPLLQQAGEVIVLSIEGWAFPGPDGEGLVRHLKAHGVKARASQIPGDWASAGRLVMEEARARRCDLIVKGAYTQSRLRQLMFGGATSHLIWNATVPVLMAH
jgi:nucleotide-binding universal stress UspA family protein